MSLEHDLFQARDELRQRVDISRTAGVVGVGIGLRSTADKQGEEPALQVVVARKHPMSALHHKDRIPANIDGLPVDVVDAPRWNRPKPGVAATPPNPEGEVAPRIGKFKRRPIVGGISCSNLYSSSGTLGYFCAGLNAAGRPSHFILGCGHVLRGRAAFGTTPSVIQPSPADGGASADVVAQFDRCVGPESGSHGEFNVDAAIAEIRPDVAFVREILEIGTVNGKQAPFPGMKVLKFGRSTGLTMGVITSIAFETHLCWERRTPQRMHHFTGLIRIESADRSKPFALPGDSGALIVSAENHSAIGMYFAGHSHGQYGLASPIDAIESALDVELCV
jgi:hypothetical protein